MGRERFRVMVLAIGSVGLIVAGTLGLDWFVANLNGLPISFGLREAKVCSGGPCVTVPLSQMGGMYPTLGTIAFFGGLAFALLVAYQAGSCLLSGFANASIGNIGHGLGSIALLCAAGAGYLYGPTTGEMAAVDLAVSVERGWGPLAMIAGLLAGQAAIRYATKYNGDSDDTYVPLERRDPAAAPATYDVDAPRPGDPRWKPPTAQPPRRITDTPPLGVPDKLKGKIKFAVSSGELTRAGIDARREVGPGVLVLWGDVVGIVARRLPPEYDGASFVDVISTAGSTLRLLPWTRLTGDPVSGDGETRIRVLVGLLAERCPEAQLDPATRAYVASTTPPAQLPDLATLAAHDARLA